MIRVYRYLMGISIRKAEKLFSLVKDSVTRSNEMKLAEIIQHKLNISFQNDNWLDAGRLWQVQLLVTHTPMRRLGSEKAPCHSWIYSTFLSLFGFIRGKLKHSQALTATVTRIVQHLFIFAQSLLHYSLLATHREASLIM